MGLMSDDEKGYGSYKQSKKQAKNYITQPGTTMGVGGIYDQDQQNFLMQNLQGVIGGQQPTQAGQLMQGAIAGLGRNMASAAQSGGSGMGAALGMRNAALQGADAGLQGIGQIGALRAQEQANARNQFLAGLQQQMGMEGLAAQNYGVGMMSKRGQNATDFGQLAGPLIGAGGAALGGALA